MSFVGSNIIAGASGQGDAGYKIERSLRFNDGDSAYLNRTPSSAGNQKKFTWSGWIKRTEFGGNKTFFSSATSNTSNPRTDWQFYDDTLYITFNPSGSSWLTVQTIRQFRDASAWYHIVVAVDTTQGTNTDRVKIYVNGVRETNLQNYSTFTQNSDLHINSATQHSIGRYEAGDSNYFPGYIAEVYLIDGQALAASDFGEYDDNNVWQPKAYSGSYGTNGFYLKFADNSSNAALGTDSSGNSNTWTVNNLVGAPAFGITSAASITSSQTISFPITYAATVTYEFFVQVTTASTYTHFAQENSASVWDIAINSSGSLLFGNFTGGWTTFTSTGLSDGNWHFVRLTTTGSSTSLYIDGTLFGTNASGGGVATTYSQITNKIHRGAFLIAHLRITTGGTPPTTGIPSISSMNQAAGTGGTLAFYDALDDIASSGTKTSDGGNVTITMAAATALVSQAGVDSLIDTPTNYTASSGNNGGNYATLNPLYYRTSTTFSNGNLQLAAATYYRSGIATISLDNGKWYYEAEILTNAANGYSMVGVTTTPEGQTYPGGNSGDDGFGWYSADGSLYPSGGTYSTWTTGDVVSVAYDSATRKTWIAKNGTWQNSGDPAAGTGSVFTIGGTKTPYFSTATGTSGVVTANFGQRPFAYTPPTGFKSLCSTNLPDPTIADGSTAMDAVKIDNASTTGSITGLSFAPDFAWFKSRGDAGNHFLLDIIRDDGVLRSNLTSAEITGTDYIDWNSDGVGYKNGLVDSGSSNIVWLWDGGTSTASNTDGSITSNVRANQSAGFSIVSYAGALSSAGSSTVGHGLNAAPSLFIVKNRDATENWVVFHESLGNAAFVSLNLTNAQTTGSSIWGSTSPTSSVFTVGYSAQANISGNNHIAYCFAPVEGYSAFGKFSGNSSTDGPFQFCGFKPRFLLLKGVTQARNWIILDTARDAGNVGDSYLHPDSNGAESTYAIADILSNGFKMRYNGGLANQTGEDYIWAAFARHPFKTARAR